MRTRVQPLARPARSASAGFVAVLTLVTGCSQLDTGTLWPWSMAKTEKPQPGRMTVAWTHATETESGRQVRGFRGRIFFYPREKSGTQTHPDKDRDTPMMVEGGLTVYAFNVMADGKLSPTAPRKFLFNPEKFQKQCVGSQQKPSYEVWLPWDTVGGPPQQISLLARFDGSNQSAVVMSEQSSQLLPGVSQMPNISRIARGEKPSTLKSAVNSSDGSVDQAGYKTTGAPASDVTAAAGEKDDRVASSPDWWK
jgi:hypothetical protein